MSSLIQPVILCGGQGTRLWPLSRKSLPKQFIAIDGELSTFQATIRRVSDPKSFLPPIVITNEEHRFLAERQASQAGGKARIILEPEPRDSGPAMAAAAAYQALNGRKDDVLLFLAADHLVEGDEAFAECCRDATEAARLGHIVTFGIPASEPATRYGYIFAGDVIAGAAKKVEAFIEKPNADRAKDLQAAGYLWNSGNFMVLAETLLDEYAKRSPETVEAAKAAIAGAKEDLGFLRLDQEAFARAPKQSIDYAVMEHTERAAVVSARFGWSDLGTWDAYWEKGPRDEHGNAFRAPAYAIDAQDSLVLSEDALVGLIGVKDILVVATKDAILVADRSRAGEVKELVERLKRAKRPEAVEHPRTYRPWGWYQTIDRGERFQVKRIVVYPGGRLSLQKHYHRAEHWVVVRGTAKITNGDSSKILQENESTFIPLGHVHRLENPGKIDLELIEVQSGSYLGEDDIVRIEDVYHRE